MATQVKFKVAKQCCICSNPLLQENGSGKSLNTHFQAYPYGTMDNDRCCMNCYVNIVVATRIALNEADTQENNLAINNH